MKNRKNYKIGHQKAPTVYNITVLYVIWYAESNESKIGCIQHTRMGLNSKWRPKIDDCGAKIKIAEK